LHRGNLISLNREIDERRKGRSRRLRANTNGGAQKEWNVIAWLIGLLMIVGSGIDLVEIERIKNAVDRYGERFLNRVFRNDEKAYCLRKRNSAESFAARFAAKEAAAKALGTGISHGVSWLEIEVVREPSGRPTLRFHGRAAMRAASIGAVNSNLSLTHSTGLAIASVVLETEA
jgi:holo-[acyl-carrier protein] synthase